MTFTPLNEVKDILIFELIYSNEIFINSNKSHHYFLQVNEVKKNGIFVLFLVWYISNNMQSFLLNSSVEYMVHVVELFSLAMESCYLYLFRAVFVFRRVM